MKIQINKKTHLNFSLIFAHNFNWIVRIVYQKASDFCKEKVCFITRVRYISFYCFIETQTIFSLRDCKCINLTGIQRAFTVLAFYWQGHHYISAGHLILSTNKAPKTCLVVLHYPALIYESWKKVLTVQLHLIFRIQNCFFYENFQSGKFWSLKNIYKVVVVNMFPF